MRALSIAIVAALAAPARADRDLCAPGARHHGATIDLDLKLADVRDVLRMLADVGHANLVASGDVDGKVTLRLKRVPWDAALCTIAAVQHFVVTFEDNILVVRRNASR